jgi:hypothetical protein
MRWKALAILVVLAIAGCGGGGGDKNSSSDSGSSGGSSSQSSKSTSTEPTTLKGARNEKNVASTLGLKKSGSGYIIASSGCKVTAIAFTKNGVVKLTAKAPKGNVIKNGSGTAAIQLDQARYFCAIQAATHLKRIP